MSEGARVGSQFVAAAQRAGGASFWHRHSPGAQWEPYSSAQCAQILGAMAQSPDSGAMPLTLGSASFEIRWGSAATSAKVAVAEFGMLQVNTRSQNSRDVKAQVGAPHGGEKAVPPAVFRRAPSFVESGFNSRVDYEAAMKEGMKGYDDELVPIAPSTASIAHAHWYWQEDESAIGKHHESDVLQPGNFVRYAGTVCAELDAKYAAWTSSGKSDSLQCAPVDLTDRIASTGTEAKAQNEHTGTAFEIDFASMRQKNTQSGYTREVRRDEFQPAAAPRPAPAPPVGVNVMVNMPPPSRAPIGPIGVDTTGDGVSDSIAVDTTGDGVPDRVVPMGLRPQAAPRLMKVAVPPGLHGGMDMQVQTPSGLMRVPIPPGLTAGQEFEFAM